MTSPDKSKRKYLESLLHCRVQPCITSVCQILFCKFTWLFLCYTSEKYLLLILESIKILLKTLISILLENLFWLITTEKLTVDTDFKQLNNFDLIFCSLFINKIYVFKVIKSQQESRHYVATSRSAKKQHQTHFSIKYFLLSDR